MPANRKAFGRRVESPTEPAPPSRPLREIPAVDPRHEARRHVLQTGKICFGADLAFTVDCIIHDISSGGMRVQVSAGGGRGTHVQDDATASIPSDVVIVHLGERIAYRARITWRRGGSIGLKFHSTIDFSEATTPELQALHRHCAEHQLRSGSSTALTE